MNEEKYKIITVSELANMLMSRKFNGTVDFTFDSVLENHEPTGWFGAKIIELFNAPEGIIVMGYYGGGVAIARCINPCEETVEELLKEMLWELSEFDEPVEKICVDLTTDNGN
jgi:hypothetical protein